MRPLACVLLVVAAGCTHAGPTASVRPVPSSSGWRELQSRHFFLRTDLPPGQARAALADFEQTYSALQALAFADDPVRERLDVVLFSDESQFRKSAPLGAAGYFMPHQYNDPDPKPTIAMHGRMLIAGELVEDTQRRFRHELTHRFLDHRLRYSPPWLEEGLAEYYSTMRVSGQTAEVGDLPNKKIFRVDIHLYGSLVEGMVEDRVELSNVPEVRELLTADYLTFHETRRELSFYAAAWTFVHMMLNGPYGYQQRFGQFMDMLAHGATPTDAWRKSFAGVPVWKLQEQFKKYVDKPEMDARLLHVSVPRVLEPEMERGLDEAEVHLMMARIRPWDSREAIVDAGHELAQARALMGNAPWPELHYWIGLYHERWRRFGDAERELRVALSDAPTDARYLLALCTLLDRGDRPNPSDPQALAAAVAQLEPLAHSAQALNFLARYYSEQGQIDQGLPFAQRAVELESGCWECADTLATLQTLKHSAPPAVIPDAYTKPSIF